MLRAVPNLKSGYEFIDCEKSQDFHVFNPWLDLDENGKFINMMYCRLCGYQINGKDFNERLTIVNQWRKIDENRQRYIGIDENGKKV